MNGMGDKLYNIYIQMLSYMRLKQSYKADINLHQRNGNRIMRSLANNSPEIQSDAPELKRIESKL